MVSIPCIRKDFTVDEYQIYQAKTFGAAAVLLICSILSEVQLGEYIKICGSLGISALVEIHNEKEAGMAVRAGARIIGVKMCIRDRVIFRMIIWATRRKASEEKQGTQRISRMLI